MKKTTLSLFLLLLLQGFRLYSQSTCLPQGIGFSTAQEIADFPTNYPGCTEVIGDVYIQTEGTDLHGLEALEAIDGSLFLGQNLVAPNNFLTSLAGLDHLRSIGNRFYLENNPMLAGLQGLDSLRSIGGNLRIFNNQALVNLGGLSHLDSVRGYLSIKTNNALIDLSGPEQLRKVGKYLLIEDNDSLKNLAGLEQLSSVSGNVTILNNGALENISALSHLTDFNYVVTIQNNDALQTLDGLNNLGTTVKSVFIYDNNALTSLSGLENIRLITDSIYVWGNPVLKNLSGLQKLNTAQNIEVRYNASLKNLAGLDSLHTVGLYLWIGSNDSLLSLKGLDGVQSAHTVYIEGNPVLPDLAGLEQAHFGFILSVQDNPALKSLAALSHVQEIPAALIISNNGILTNLAGLDNLEWVGNEFFITRNKSLKDLSGLSKLDSLHRLYITYNDSLVNLHGLEQVRTIDEELIINSNPLLNDVSALANLDSVGYYIGVADNHALSACAVYPLCYQANHHPLLLQLNDNGPGCNTVEEIKTDCGGKPVLVRVLIDQNNDCLADAGDLPAPDIQVQLNGNIQQALRPTGVDGSVHFGYLDTGLLRLSLPQFPDQIWQACQDTLSFLPGSIADTIRATFLLNATVLCPRLTVDLGLPAFFRGCLAPSKLQATARNIGGATAEAVRVALVLPGELQLVSSMPTLPTQSGDTLFFDLGDFQPFQSKTVSLIVKTDCNADLVGHTLCLEALTSLANPCPTTALAFSEIRLSSQCLGDTTVRFTLKNVGDAPTLGPHQYTIFKNADVLLSENFSLNNQQSLTVGLPADGSTYRMEATKFDNGTLTATAREGCGGFTAGQITAFWLDQGLSDYDFDCREVRVAYDPNLKTAVPAGAGPEHELPANRPIQYTIDFQNTGSDTAFRVLLKDVLSPQLDPSSFRPNFASHPYTWQIVGADTLEVLFSPIMLPDSTTNEPASHGWFNFSIDQKPDLSEGSMIENKASIIFDFNSPITTNTVVHTIDNLIVNVEEPAAAGSDWQVLPNPVRYTATFQSRTFIPGKKRFELVDALGRVLRTEYFEGQKFEFPCANMLRGLYYFRIYDALGKATIGKLVLSE